MRTSDWSSDVCSSDLRQAADIVVALDRDAGAAGEGDALDHVRVERALGQELGAADPGGLGVEDVDEQAADDLALLLRIGHPGKPAEEEVPLVRMDRSEEHTSELQSLMRISYAVFCLKKKKHNTYTQPLNIHLIN